MEETNETIGEKVIDDKSNIKFFFFEKSKRTRIETYPLTKDSQNLTKLHVSQIVPKLKELTNRDESEKRVRVDEDTGTNIGHFQPESKKQLEEKITIPIKESKSDKKIILKLKKYLT